MILYFVRFSVHLLTSHRCHVTFEATVSADEEEADFIPVCITHGFRWTSRNRRAAVERLLSGVSHILRHCGGQRWVLSLTGIFKMEGKKNLCSLPG